MNRHSLIVALLIAVIGLAPPTTRAQEELDENRTVLKRDDPVHSMTEPVYRRLSAAHEQLGEDQLDEALDTLRKLQKTRLNKYEKALVYQTLGFVYAQQSDNENAIKSFEQSLALESMPGQAHQGMLYSLAGLYLAENQFEQSIATIREWFRYEPDPLPDAYMMIASSYTELQQFDAALPYVLMAIDKAEKPRENWYMMALAIHFEKVRFDDAIPVLKTMLEYWPDKPRYWDMLAGSYLEIEDDQKALDTMMLAYNNNMITSESRVLAVVQLNMLQGIPFAAGTILEAELDKGTVAEEKRTLDMLLQAWMTAREYDRAVATINRLTPYAKGGEYFLQAAGIYNETGEWQKVADNAGKALDAGLEEPIQALMLAGTAYSELDRFDEALSAFTEVREIGDNSERRNADSWINFVKEKQQIRNAALASN